MLKKLAAHLKNVILFKAILYSLLLIALSVLVPLFRQELEASSKDNEMAKESLIETTQKLESIVNSEGKILDIAKRYNKTLDRSDKQSCKYRSNLMSDVMKLANKYNLPDPIAIGIYKMNMVDSRVPDNSQVRIEDYAAAVNYISPNFEKSLSIAQEIYSLMPIGTVILNIEIRNNEVLDPVAISKLSKLAVPNFIHSNMEMRIGEIVVSK